MIAGLVFERDSITSQATSIGQLETVGLSWQLIDQELAELEAVTPADIQRLAQQYLKSDTAWRALVVSSTPATAAAAPAA